MKLPEKKSKVKSQKSKVILGIVIFFFFFFFPKSINASFVGGINIGDHYSEFDQAAQASGGLGWVYVMMTPSNASLINQWLATYPNIKLIIRGHVPDSGGNTLTAEYANAWADVLANVSKPVYFVPVNEPNNPNESMTGIPASVVVNYVRDLKNALTAKNILGSKVILLSPTIDVYTLSDNGPAYINELGGWPFFEHFSGIALNLYGQFKDGVLDQTAPPIKRGQGYRDFLQAYFGANPSQATAANVYAVETGVLKVGDPGGVKYKENSPEIVSYLNTVKPIWSADPNFKMFAIFSYDPAGDRSPWIYTDNNVLTAMNLQGGNIPTISPTQVADFSDEINTFSDANEKLLPKMIQDQVKVQEKNCNGITIFNVCIGTKTNPAELAHQTGQFQPVFVPPEKVVDSNSCQDFFGCFLSAVTVPIIEIFNRAINPQLDNPPTGSLNAFRPAEKEFSQIGDSGNKYIAQNSQEEKVLGVKDNPESKTKQSYAFTMKMLLPSFFGKNIAVPTYAPTTPGVSTPTPTFIPGQPTPTSPPVYTCVEGVGYCSVSFLDDYFPTVEIARQASMICQRESTSNPMATNSGCLTGRSLDYSIGLFQINLLAHVCPEVFDYDTDPISCTILDYNKLAECEAKMKDPLNNIYEALRISGNGSNWNPWAAAKVCGIVQ